MARNKPSRVLPAVLLTAGLLLAGCAGASSKTGAAGKAETPGASVRDSTHAGAPDSAGRGGMSVMDSSLIKGLSDATKLLLQAVDNYVDVVPQSKRTPEVIMLKGHTFYNNKIYAAARQSYARVIEQHQDALEVPEAIKMTAQTFYEENRFAEAQDWYKKLKDAAVSGQDKEEATVRLAESYFRLGEKFREQGRLDKAIDEFERVVIEFPTAKIADAALYNVGVLYEERKEWSKSILSFNKLLANYAASGSIEPALFHIAKCYEQMSNWSQAALTYVEIFKRFPASPKIKDALYNAGLSYEKEENFLLAAKMFEKYAQEWPKDKEAPDVLFKAGELYGKIEDWGNVERINGLFGERYGNDKGRIVMAQCMTGIASYMQKKYDKALQELEKAIATAKRLGLDNKVNAFYGAKAQFTVGEINQELAQRITLILPESEYQARLKKRIGLTEDAVSAFTRVSAFKLIEWTTRAIYKIGETYEQFGSTLFKRERPKALNYQKMLALEEGISRAVEQYLVNKALEAHTQNVDFGIQYKYEDEWTARSRQQLTKLPFLAAKNYSQLIQIAAAAPADASGKDNPMKLIQDKLEQLQNVAPFQDKAIALYLKTLEMAAKYGIEDKYKGEASTEVTGTSFSVGRTYAEVVAVARGAPVPASYDGYKRFFYKVHLLGEGLVEYENSAIAALYKNIKIGEAYGINDEWIKKSREKIAEVLFTRSLCYEILAEEALRTPPIPAAATEVEADEYRLQFEELGYKLQDEAYNLYRDIFAKGGQGVTAGPYLDMTYSRLFARYPNEVGVKIERDTLVTLRSDKGWRFSREAPSDWKSVAFADSEWQAVTKATKPDSVGLLGFAEPVTGIWGGGIADGRYVQAPEIYMRKQVQALQHPRKIRLECTAAGPFELHVNGAQFLSDSLVQGQPWYKARKREIPDGTLKPGRNILAVHAKATVTGSAGFYLYLTFEDRLSEVRPKLPSQDRPITRDELKRIKFEFPLIPNFEYKPELFSRSGP